MTNKTEAIAPLIELLAATDAIFSPIRDWSDNGRVVAILERREVFRRAGLPIRLGGVGEAERKKTERFLDEIEQSGAVEVFRSSGKRSHWKLANEADWKIRRLCLWSDFPEMLNVMLALREYEQMGCTNAGHVGDWMLAAIPGDTDDERLRGRCFSVEWAVLPGARSRVGHVLVRHPRRGRICPDPRGPQVSFRSAAAHNRVAEI